MNKADGTEVIYPEFQNSGFHISLKENIQGYYQNLKQKQNHLGTCTRNSSDNNWAIQSRIFNRKIIKINNHIPVEQGGFKLKVHVWRQGLIYKFLKIITCLKRKCGQKVCSKFP